MLLEGRRRLRPLREARNGKPMMDLASSFFVTVTSVYCHKLNIPLSLVAGTTGLEPATSAVTGQRSNQLSYVPPDVLSYIICEQE
jgi:hypothetical protein